MQNTLIECISLSKSIESRVIIDNVNFKINRGELVTVIGPNGAGKTTLARLILGLEHKSSGIINIAQKNIKIGYVPQKIKISENLPITVSCFLNILSPNLKNRVKSNDNLTNELLEFAKFYDLKNLDISQLSGGQLQKILIVAALLNNSDMVILDEPTKYLDINAQQEFYLLLDKVRISKNLTIFMVSHDLYTVMKNSTQIICLNRHICCSGSLEEIKESDLSSLGFFIHKHDHKH